MVIKMKVTLQQIDTGNEEVIVRYRQMTQQIEDIVQYVEGKAEKLAVTNDGQQFLINIPDVIYLESVDGITFVYTQEEVYRTALTLTLFGTLYADKGFFRCSKAAIINIYRIDRLKSMPGSRIDAMMDNGEHIIISRRYAKELRRVLKGEER